MNGGRGGESSCCEDSAVAGAIGMALLKQPSAARSHPEWSVCAGGCFCHEPSTSNKN